MGKIKLYCLLFYMRGAPSTGVYKPLSIVCLCRTRLAVSVVLTTCLGALAGEAALLWGCQGSRTVFRAGGTLNVFPLMR